MFYDEVDLLASCFVSSFPHFVFAALLKGKPFFQICFGVRFPRSSLKKVLPCRSALGVPVFFPVFWLAGPKARICVQRTRWTLKGKHLWLQRPHGIQVFGPSNELRFEDPGALFRPEELWLRQGKRVRMAGVSSFEGSRLAVCIQGNQKDISLSVKTGRRGLTKRRNMGLAICLVKRSLEGTSAVRQLIENLLT